MAGTKLTGLRRKIEDRVGEYVQQHDPKSLTPLDNGQLRQLATLEVQIEKLLDDQADLDSNDPLQLKKVVDLTDTIDKLSREARQLAKALRLDRSSRQSMEKTDLELYLPKLAERAKKFLYYQALQIICYKCAEEPAKVDIRQGTIIWHFAWVEDQEWSFKAKCPRCNQPIDINNTNWRHFTLGRIEQRMKELKQEAQE